jgi:hypothetical protein
MDILMTDETMTRIKVEFETVNAAFDNYARGVSAHMLRQIADKLENGADGGKVRDVNGNTVGTWEVWS